MNAADKLPDMTPIMVEHAEMKLIGLPCVSLNNMAEKYQHAKESLLTISAYLPQVIDPNVHYGVWPQVETQANPDTHAYILCVEVGSFEGIPDWFVKLTMPPQRCVAVASANGDFEVAGQAIDAYIRDKQLTVSGAGREYIVCERYRLAAEGFSRYSLPIAGNR